MLLCVSNAFADDFFIVKERVLGEAQWKLGFLYLKPMLLLQNVGYMDNIYTYDEEKTPDWTGDFGLGLGASAIVANRLILDVEELPFYSFYLNTVEQRSWNNRLRATLYSYVGRFNLKAGFVRDQLHMRPNLEFGRPYPFVDQEWFGEIDVGKHSAFFLTAFFRLQDFEYGSDPYLGGYDLNERLSQRQTIFGLRLNQRLFTRTQAFAEYEHTRYSFVAGNERDANAQQLALGVKLPEIGVLQGSVRIGVKQFEPSNPLFQRVRKPSGQGDLTLTLFKRLRLSAIYDLQTYFSYLASDLFYDSQSFGGGAELYLTQSLKMGASYRDSRLRFHSFLDLALLRTDRLRLQQYFLAVPIIRHMALGIAYNVYRLTSPVLGLDYTRTYWGGFINYEF